MATTTLYAQKDAYFDDYNNYGTSTRIKLGFDGLIVSEMQHAALDFGVNSTFPTGTTITSAILRLKRNTSYGGSGSFIVTAKGINSSWSETTITDSSLPSLGSSTYSSSTYSGGDYLEINVTSRVQWWVDNPTKYGLYLYTDAAKTEHYSFYSREDSVYDPRLIVTYEAANTAPTWPAGASATTSPSGTISTSTSSITVSWTAATDAEGDTLTYKVTPYIGGVAQTQVTGITGTSYSHSIGTGNAGQTYYYRVWANDGAEDTTTYLTSNTVTKNTLPTWVSTTVSVDTYTANTIIPENDNSLIVAWTAGNANNTGQTLVYDIYRSTNGGAYSKLNASSQTGVSYTDSTATGGQGTTYQYKIYMSDGLDWASTQITSAVITKNTLTAATLASSSSVAFSTASVTWTWSGASNTNSNGTFTYRINSADITVYNQANNITTPDTMIIWRTGDATPSGTDPYIKFDDIKTKFSGSNYNGSLTFTLTTTNAYGSSKTSSKTISVDLRTAPTGLGTPTLAASSYYTINSVNYYIPDRKTITIDWTAATDPLGTTIVYDVQISLAGGTYTTIRSNLATNTTTYNTGVAVATTCQFKVIAKPAYGTPTATSSASTLVTLNYWNPPTLSITGINRTATGFTFTGSITQGTTSASALNSDYSSNPKYRQLGTGTIYYDWPVTEITLDGGSSSSFTIGYRNWGYYGIVSTTNYVTDIVTISTYQPMFSIRETGVAVNSTPANDGYKFRVAGNVLISADSGGNANLTINGLIDTIVRIKNTGTHNTIVQNSSTAGEFLFGGSTSDGGGIGHYIRIGADKLQFTSTSYTNSNIWHAGNLNPSDYVPTTRTVTAGNGMTGGGALSGNITLTMGTPGTCTASSTSTVTSTSHTHAITTTESGANSTIVQTTSSGYVYAQYFNSVNTATTTTAAVHYFMGYGTDGFIRKKTLANVKTEIVTSAAVFNALDNVHIQTGTVYITAASTWYTHTFPTAFAGVPRVILQPISTSATTSHTARMNTNVTSTSFQFALATAGITLHYIAIYGFG